MAKLVNSGSEFEPRSVSFHPGYGPLCYATSINTGPTLPENRATVQSLSYREDNLASGWSWTAPRWGAGLSSTYPPFPWIVCPHDYKFLLSLQLCSAFSTIGFLFYDFNINDLLVIVIPQTAQPAIEIKLPKPTAKLNRGNKCTLSSKNQNWDSRQSTTPATCIIHSVGILGPATHEACKYTCVHFLLIFSTGAIYMATIPHQKYLWELVVFVELPQFSQKQSILRKTKGKKKKERVFSLLTILWVKGSQDPKHLTSPPGIAACSWRRFAEN